MFFHIPHKKYFPDIRIYIWMSRKFGVRKLLFEDLDFETSLLKSGENLST